MRDEIIVKNEIFGDYNIANVDQLPDKNEYRGHKIMHIWSIDKTVQPYFHPKLVATTWQKLVRYQFLQTSLEHTCTRYDDALKYSK